MKRNLTVFSYLTVNKVEIYFLLFGLFCLCFFALRKTVEDAEIEIHDTDTELDIVFVKYSLYL